MKIHHVGYLVDDINGAKTEMENLGFTAKNEICFDQGRKLNILFMNNNGYTIELIEVVDKKSPFYALRKKHKNSPYHLCYETKNIKTKIEELCQKNGYMLVLAPELAPAIEKTSTVAFLMNATIGMIELVEK